MRAFTFGALALSATLSFGQAATTLTSIGGSYTINAGSYTGSSLALSGSANFFCNGVTGDYAFRDMWAYRIQGDSREYMVTSPSATFGGIPGSTFTATMFKGQNGSDVGVPMIRLDVTYRIGANSATSPTLEKCVQITNLTNGNLDFSLFHYMDYDIPGTSPDFFSLNSSGSGTNLVQQRDTAITGNYAEAYFAGVGGPMNYRHDLLYGTFFTNTTPDQMNSTLFGGTGDLAMGWQLDATLAPGQQSVCPGCIVALNGSVPEPVTAVVLFGGLVGWAFRLQKRGK